MRTIDKYPNHNDEFFHPLWLGLLILFSVMIIIGILCCIRIKCGAQFRALLNRLFGRNIKKNDDVSNEDKTSTIRSSYNWPSSYTPTRTRSPKLYSLIKNIQTTNLEKQSSLRRKNGNEDENEREISPAVEYDQAQLSIPSPIDENRSSEIARKFYASMRHNSQCQTSLSLDSYNNLSFSNNTRSNIDQTIKPDRDENINSFRTPRFFQSIPITDGLGMVL